MKFSLSGAMIPRHVRRMFEQRDEARAPANPDSALLCRRGRVEVVRLGNISPSGAMLWFDQELHIGERVAVQLIDHEAIQGQVRWIKDGQVGINFTSQRG